MSSDVRHRPVWSGLWIAGALVLAAGLVWPLVSHALEQDGHRLIDLEVYRAAGRAVLDGVPVYDFRTGQDLPFTYPPIAAWLAIPLALLPFGLAGVLWTATSLGLLAALIVVVWRPVWARLGWAVVPLLVAGIAWVFPARDNIVLGQVNLLLAALVLLDCALPRTRWPRGVLVGLATAVKLTPGLFIPYLWLSGRRRAAYTAAGTFAGLAAATWLVLPGDSSRYWLREMWHPTRLGHNWYTTNQSIRGLALHFRLRGVATALVILALSALTLRLLLRRAPALSRAGDELAAVTVVGLASNLLSPVAWVHHFVWFLVAVPVLVHDWREARRAWWGLGLLALIAYKTIYWGAGIAHTNDGPLDFAGRIVQSSFTLAALALIAWLPARSNPDRPADQSDSRDRASPAYA